MSLETPLIEPPEITVRPSARLRRDQNGDPLDGLVNLFDLGIVLAVAFLLAALSSLQLSDILTSKDVSVVRDNGQTQTVITKKDDKVETVDLTNQKVVGQGTRVGSVYRLSDGRTVVVQEPSGQAAPDSTTPPDGSALPPASGTTPPADGTTPPASDSPFSPFGQ
jgi:hypothetical protein